MTARSKKSRRLPLQRRGGSSLTHNLGRRPRPLLIYQSCLFKIPPVYQRITLSRIAFARPIESAMTVAKRGEGRLMFSSRASLIPAMIEAAITRVEENLSLVRCSSSYLVACSRAIARFISPMSAPLPSALACESTSWKVCLDKCPEAHTDSFHCIEDIAQ